MFLLLSVKIGNIERKVEPPFELGNYSENCKAIINPMYRLLQCFMNSVQQSSGITQSETEVSPRKFHCSIENNNLKILVVTST